MTRKELKISAVQCDLIWEDVDRNFLSIEEKLNDVPDDTDLIVLPEMFGTGFSMNAKDLAVDMNGKEVLQIKKWSQQLDAAIAGSLIVEENDNYYNRLLWVNPDGKVFSYDKKHLFSFASEDKTFTPGTNKLVVNYKGWNIACFICYDLRFPVWSRNVGNQYDVALYVANWPEKRISAWDSLLSARAIENQAYVVGVNRVGHDGNNIKYCGSSALINYLGESVVTVGLNEDSIMNCTFQLDELNDFREKFPVMNDADNFTLT